MSPKILTICPSKYPDKLISMMDSYLVTRSKYNNIIINYDNNSITKIFNKIFEENPDYDFYFMANDDIIFNTPLWDLELANKNCISFGNDNIQNHNLCTFPMIDGNIVRALGWLQMPTLEKYCGDTVWSVIGNSCGNLRHCPQVSIDHLWEGCSHPDVHTADMGRFAEWLAVSNRDIEKVRRIVNG